MHNNTALVEARIDRFASERIAPAIYRRFLPLTVEAWEVPGEPVPFDVAVVQDFAPFATGSPWGRPWGTTWFHLTGTVPAGWAAGSGTIAELAIDLGFSRQQPGFQAEGLVYRHDGSIVKAIEPFSASVPLSQLRGAGRSNDSIPHDSAPKTIDVYVEAASNPDVAGSWTFFPTALGDTESAGADPIYRLRRADLAERDSTVYALSLDVWCLVGLMRELDPALPRRAEILRALERMMDLVDPHDVAGTASAGRRALAAVLASPAAASAHRIVAVGHAHIDSAWLWPVRETVRKVARTFSNVLALMDEYPDLVFGASSAQQYSWIRDAYPDLFERIRARVAEGRFVPLGGMWVESDTNMPGGEALVRQFVAGQGFFLREFGAASTEGWLPDSFGYTAALPQLARAAGLRYFFTQKLSWNETNRMPHHTFLWEGIDGSRVFTHFTPSDTYNSDLSAADLARAQRQYAEKGAGTMSMAPFGWGDGGGGPTAEMVEAAHRAADLEGSPRVTLGSPHQFFEAAEAELADPAVWSGELYLEFHRGTYTSQARTKAGNRRSEHLLREAELWSATAAVRRLIEYPYRELASAWHLVLLQQFHDILPGSSIAWVYRQAEADYADVAARLERLIAVALGALAGPGEGIIGFNAAPVTSAGPAGIAPLTAAEVVTVARVGIAASAESGFLLDNGLVVARFSVDGLLVSLLDHASGRDLIAPGEEGGLLQVFRDTPARWDAWDIDDSYRRTGTDLRTAESVGLRDDALIVTRRFGSSTATQRFWLEPGEPELQIETTIDWHEKQKLLKLSFPFDVHADRAASEIQFGHVYRPTHTNTSWDFARFETCAHRWVHVGEPGFGVAVCNSATYGHDISRTTRADGGTTTLVRESLLRAPTFPDPHADQGSHSFRTSVRVSGGVLDAVTGGYRLNLPVRTVLGGHAVVPIVSVDAPAVMIEAVKLAEDRSGDVVVRLYEARGARATTTVRPGFDVETAWTTDLLERARAHTEGAQAHPERANASDSGRRTHWSGADRIVLVMRPFEVVTLRLHPRAGGSA
jgi:alpha-mannosidase